MDLRAERREVAMVILLLMCEWVAIGDEDVLEDGATKGANTSDLKVGLLMSCGLVRICQWMFVGGIVQDLENPIGDEQP
jgi:hypothetical protein